MTLMTRSKPPAIRALMSYVGASRLKPAHRGDKPMGALMKSASSGRERSAPASQLTAPLLQHLTYGQVQRRPGLGQYMPTRSGWPLIRLALPLTRADRSGSGRG